MSERRRPDLDQVRESLREHDERAAQSTDEPPAPAEPPSGGGDEGEPAAGGGGDEGEPAAGDGDDDREPPDGDEGES